MVLLGDNAIKPNTQIEREAASDVLLNLERIASGMRLRTIDPDDAVDELRDMVIFYDKRISGDRKMRK